MAKIFSKDELAEIGGEVEFEEQGPARIEGLETLVAEMRALVAAQRATIGVSGDQTESNAALVKSISALMNKVGAGKGSGDMTQKVLEGMLTQLSRIPVNNREPNPVYLFEIERTAMGYISSIKATPTPAGA